MTAKVLEVQNLKKYFPVKTNLFGRGTEFVKAVDGVDFHINSGEILGLVGESGSGKTTTGRTIIRLLDPTEGEIIFDGQDITNIRKKDLRKTYEQCSLSFRILCFSEPEKEGWQCYRRGLICTWNEGPCTA